MLLLASAAAFMYRERIGVMVAFARLKPEQSYTALPPPSAREYSNPSSWAALPDTDDAADVVPARDVQDLQSSAPVDVFFVHPTTYYKNEQLYAARPMGRDHYHIYDYNLFHMNLRRNAQMRAAQFLSRHGPLHIKVWTGTPDVRSENF